MSYKIIGFIILIILVYIFISFIFVYRKVNNEYPTGGAHFDRFEFDKSMPFVSVVYLKLENRTIKIDHKSERWSGLKIGLLPFYDTVIVKQISSTWH